MDKFPGSLSYGLHLIIGFVCVEVDRRGRLFALGSAWSMVVLESGPAPDVGLSLRTGFPREQIGALILQIMVPLP